MEKLEKPVASVATLKFSMVWEESHGVDRRGTGDPYIKSTRDGKLLDRLSSLLWEARKRGLASTKEQVRSESPAKFYDLGGLTTIVDKFEISGLAAVLLAFLKVMRPVIVEWIRSKSSIRVTVKVDNTSIEVRDPQDLDHVIEILGRAPKQKREEERID